MPLCTSRSCFEGYALDRIPVEVLAHLQRRPEWNKTLAARVLRLQCFLEVTDQRCPPVDEDRAVVEALFQEFAAATFAGLIGHGSSPWFGLSALRRAWPTQLSVDIPGTRNSLSWPKGFAERVEYYRNLEIDPDLAEFWQGWTFANANEKLVSLALWRFWRTFGKQRTRELAEATKEWFGKGRHDAVSCTQAFIDFSCDYGNVDFENSESLGELLGQFFRHHFQNGHGRGAELSYLGARWRTFSLLLHDHLLGKAWATPVPAVPSPLIAQKGGARTHIKPGADGQEVKMSLITPVPLHVSDSQAKELIFSSIKSDFDVILAWARKEVAEARTRLDRRKALAREGTISETSAAGICTGLRYRRSRQCPEHLAHAAATFEAKGFQHLESGRGANRLYPVPTDQTAWELGLPTPPLLLAYATVLVASHPEITPIFLEELHLFDKDGQQVGFIKSDAGWHLRGDKRRRGPAKAEQDILLNYETQAVVRDLIAVTQPLRDWLRAENRPNWRRLFMGIAGMGSKPRAWSPTQEARLHSNWIAKRMTALVGIDAERAALLSQRLSLKRLRSSAGVLIYFETGSVEAMAKALGHAKWSPQLLDHYLPAPLQEFFTERWIRLFQTGIICEALQGSSYLMEAASFRTIYELDEFLENHAFRRLPAHLNSPDQPGGKEQPRHKNDRIVFGIETGILTILISLENAVRTASREPCGQAIRWARISERLVPYLETQSEQPEFQTMVSEAKRRANPRLVEELIYG